MIRRQPIIKAELRGKPVRIVNNRVVEILRFIPLTASGHPDKRSLPRSYHRSLSPQGEIGEPAPSAPNGGAGTLAEWIA